MWNKWLGLARPGQFSIARQVFLQAGRINRGHFNRVPALRCIRRGYNGFRSPKGGLLMAAGGALAASTTAVNVEEQKNEEIEVLKEAEEPSLVPLKSAETTEEGLYEASVQEDKERKRIRQNNTILWRLMYFIGDWIVDPTITCLRFVQLSVMFIPVMVSLPIVLFGPRDPLRSNEKRGTILWYRYLTWTMELAGPSFIKVQELDDYLVWWSENLFCHFLITSFSGLFI